VFPPPLWGRVREGGGCEAQIFAMTPTLNPSPQGGGELTEFKAS
jgi:hypothetical protein